jgi:hypothetical protein
MRLTIVYFLLLTATICSLRAQTVSSISIGNPSCAIIEGNIVDEGESFTFKGATYTVKKITADAVTVVDKNGKEQTLMTGKAPARPPTNATKKSETSASHKTWTRDELKQKISGRTKSEVISAIGKPTSTEMDNSEPHWDWEVWTYAGISKDPVSGNVDRWMTIRWLNSYRAEYKNVMGSGTAGPVKFTP